MWPRGDWPTPDRSIGMAGIEVATKGLVVIKNVQGRSSSSLSVATLNVQGRSSLSLSVATLNVRLMPHLTEKDHNNG